MIAAAAMASRVRLRAREKKPARKPDVEFLKVASVRQEGVIRFEGDFKITGEKPVPGLIVSLHFFESGGILLTIQKLEIEEGTLNPGELKHFGLQGNDVPRAVSFKLSATDKAARDLNIAGAGPYPLD